MRAVLLVTMLVSVGLVGCLGGDDGAGTTHPPNPFPTAFGLRLTCMDAVEELTECTRVVHDGPANELSIAVNPTDPDNLIGGSKDYGLGPADACGEHRVWSGVYASHDGGVTWTHAFFPGHPDDDTTNALSGFECNSDPVLAFGPNGTAYYSGLAYGGESLNTGGDTPRQQGSAIWMASSDDGGRTWADPVVVAESDGETVFHDKQWVATGPGGFVIVTWTAFVGPPALPVEPPDSPLALVTGQVLFSVSTDHGATWTEPSVLYEADTRTPTSPQLVGTDKQFSSPAVDSDGNVYVTWLGFGEEADTIFFAKGSPDATGTYSFGSARSIHEVASIPSPLPNTQFRASTYPVLAADPGTPGSLVLVWADNGEGHADILFSRSSDGGNSWSSPDVVNDDGGTNDQWMPWVQVDDRGGVHVVWFDRRDDPDNRLIDVYYGYAPDGDNFLPNARVTPASFDGDLSFHQTGVPFIGDYIGLAVASLREPSPDGGFDISFRVHPFWPDTSNGSSEVHTARLEILVGRPGEV